MKGRHCACLCAVCSCTRLVIPVSTFQILHQLQVETLYIRERLSCAPMLQLSWPFHQHGKPTSLALVCLCMCISSMFCHQLASSGGVVYNFMRLDSRPAQCSDSQLAPDQLTL